MKKGKINLLTLAFILSIILLFDKTAFALEIKDHILEDFNPGIELDAFSQSVDNNASGTSDTMFSGANISVYPVFIELDESSFTMHSFYVEDTYGSGESYFISSAVVDGLYQQGAKISTYLNGDYHEITSLGNDGIVSFLACDAIANYYPIKMQESMSAENLCMVELYINEKGGLSADEKGCIVLETSTMDLSSWENVGDGYVSGNTSVSTHYYGAPILDASSSAVVGMLSGIWNENAEAYELICWDLTQISFNPQFAVTSGSDGNTGSGESTGSGGSTGSTGSGGSTESGGIPAWVYGAVFGGVGALIIQLKKNKKEDVPKPTPEEKDKPKKDIKEGTVMLDGDAAIDYVEPPKPIVTEPQNTFQVRCLDGDFKGRTFPLYDVLGFGRNPVHRIAFGQNTKGISGNHCELRIENGRIVLRDLGSTYGTFFMNGQKLDERVAYEVKKGDVFYLAEKTQSFRIEDAGETRQEFTPAVEAVTYPCAKKIYRADENGRMTFGRSTHAQVSFDSTHTRISTNHCVLYRDHTGLFLMDLGSTNGTFLEGNRRLKPNVPYRMTRGSAFYLNSMDYLFVITEE